MARKTIKNSSRASNGKAKSKAAFVRNLPPDLPAAEVIARAQANGMKLTPAYVYVIRSKNGAKPNGKLGGRGRAGMRGAGPAERQFVDLALQLGFSRAQQLLDSTRASIQRVVHG